MVNFINVFISLREANHKQIDGDLHKSLNPRELHLESIGISTNECVSKDIAIFQDWGFAIWREDKSGKVEKNNPSREQTS